MLVTLPFTEYLKPFEGLSNIIPHSSPSFPCSGEDGKPSKTCKLLSGGPVVKNTEPPLKRSLFSNVPPSINFVHHNEVPETPLPTELRKNLKWKLSNITPAVVKKVVTNSGYRLMRKTCTEWGGTWGKHMKSFMFKVSLLIPTAMEGPELDRYFLIFLSLFFSGHWRIPKNQPHAWHVQYWSEGPTLEELPAPSYGARERGIQLPSPDILSSSRHQAAEEKLGEKGGQSQVDCQATSSKSF